MGVGNAQRPTLVRRCILKWYWLVASLFAPAASAFAEDLQPSEQSELAAAEALSLEALMAQPLSTGSFLDLDLRSSPVSMTIIRREQIKTSAARTLSELLEIYVPGFQYMVNKWNGEVWGMRGVATGRNTKIIFLINGLKQNTESRDGAFTETDLGLLADIERVEVLRGPAGLVYGSGAIAGVVNLVTRHPEQSSGELTTSYGSGQSMSGEALASVQRDEWKLTVAGGYRRSDGLGNRDTKIYGQPSFPTAYDENFQAAPLPNGVPSDGSMGETPGNYRLSADISRGNVRLYTRYTHRETSAGPYFVVDPYPEYVGLPPADASTRNVDGQLVGPTDPLARAESFGTNRQRYIVDNLTTHLSYRVPLGPDELTTEAAFTMAQNRIGISYRAGYGVPLSTRPAGAIFSSMGERRYYTGLQYVLRRLHNVESASGAQLRVDDLGRDFEGINMYSSEKHKDISDVVYTNVALYNETHYLPHPALRLVAGVRMDKHTRTTYVFNGKGAVVYSPSPFHSLKLLGQSSSNNGSADNYEYNYNHYRDDGSVATATSLADGPSNTPPQVATTAVSKKQLHALEPERAYSLELASTHLLFDFWTIMPSASYTRVTDLFAWSPALRREVNAGAYSVLSLELDTHLEIPRAALLLGASHVYQRVVAPDRSPKSYTEPAWEPVQLPDGTWDVQETGELSTVEVNTIDDQVSKDGKNFLNLHSHVSKLYVDWTPLAWLALHSDLRVFWGLHGRAGAVHDSRARGFSYLAIDRLPAVRWNAGVRFLLPQGFVVAAHGYNLLGTRSNRNALRWQQMADPSQSDLYAVDVATFSILLEKAL